MKRVIVAVFLFSIAGVANDRVAARTAHPTRVRRPLIGFVVRQSPLEIHPVSGMVGASTLEPALAMTGDLKAVFAAPARPYAITVRTGGTVASVPLSAGAIGDAVPLAGALPDVDRVSFSPGAASAVLLSTPRRKMQVWTGLPGAARLLREVDASSFAAGLAAVAVSDDGRSVLAAFSAGDTAFVAAIGEDGIPAPLFHASSVSAIRFLGSTHDAVIADPSANRVTLLVENASAPGVRVPRVLAESAQGVAAPLDLEGSADGRRVFIANSAARSLLMIDIATGEVRPLRCSFTPAGFQRLAGPALAVTASGSDGTWLLDTDSPAPWVTYVVESR